MPKKKEQSEPSQELVSQVFSMMGKRGGPARSESLSAKRRKEIAQKAAAARWGSKKKDASTSSKPRTGASGPEIREGKIMAQSAPQEPQCKGS